MLEPGHFSEAEDDEPAEPSPSPEVVYLPCQRVMHSGEHSSTVELRRTDHDELALPVFTSLERLVACCGGNQAWVSVESSSIDDIVARSGADAVAVDQMMPGTEEENR
ncbi:SAV_915 family protein [Actinopolyspora halophila]|uniref:SAV_915 family protein n=1 Tax=Actinopolyspora halophila TaxID=1850 RepID=UPI001461650C|nr:SAV_915 family protein [Actinopolyspora halophila]